MNCFCAVSCA